MLMSKAALNKNGTQILEMAKYTSEINPFP